MKKLTKFIKLYYTILVRTWLHWYKLTNMVSLIQHIQPQWATMWLNSCQKTTCYQKKKCAIEKFSTADELVVKAQYMNCMQDNTNYYQEKSIQHNNTIAPPMHNCTTMLGFHHCQQRNKRTKSVCNKNQALNDIQRIPICFNRLWSWFYTW